MKILILNGPNLNLLGKREPEVYGRTSFEDYFKTLKDKYPGTQLEYFQSNSEGDIISKIHQRGFSYDGIVLNAGAYTHTSIAIADAIRAVTTPVVELHISNVYAREEFRHRSMIAPACRGCICGFGLEGYGMAIESFLQSVRMTPAQRKDKRVSAPKAPRKKTSKTAEWNGSAVREAALSLKQEKKKLPQIVAEINQMGLKTPRGKAWTVQTLGILLRKKI